jgi:acetyl-CoA acetyltransferase
MPEAVILALVHELRRRSGRLGLAMLGVGVGVGQGQAALFRSVPES